MGTDTRTSELPSAAMLSVHTSPIDQPGTGDSGGMNVYIRSVATRLEERGIDIDLFTRCRGGVDHETKHLTKHAHVVSIKAGPCEPIPKAVLPRYLPEFLGGVIRHARMNDRRYDLVHSHYWLSGWVGNALHDLWNVPLVSSFHTLGKVKNYSLAPGEAAEPTARIDGEMRVIAASDRILAPTPAEAGQLVGLYRADPDHIRLVPAGVDHVMFTPRDREQARERLYLKGLRLALFVGRLQPHKGPDIAIRTVAESIALDPVATKDLQLAIVGGPSGSDVGEIDRLMDLIAALGINDRVIFFPPQPQERLADFYAAADLVLVPSRSESFGLVALEAQACGTPVVAAAVGGLRYVVEDGVTGYLVGGHDPGDHAERLLAILSDREGALRMGRAGVRQSMRFSWDATAAAALGVYHELADDGRGGRDGSSPAEDGGLRTASSVAAG
jgi:D-inositol-3-phosphate glycosyltransferase